LEQRIGLLVHYTLTRPQPPNFPMTLNIRLVANRQFIVLKPKESFLKWIVEADPESPKPTVEHLLDDLDSFLIPEFAGETTEDVKRWVNKHWRMFFE
jgi:hypothetical protein